MPTARHCPPRASGGVAAAGGAGAAASPYVVPASLQVRSMLKTLFIATSIVGLRVIRPMRAFFGHSRERVGHRTTLRKPLKTAENSRFSDRAKMNAR